MNNKSFSYIISRFFRIYLPSERGYSTATIQSYRDTFKQFLNFISQTKQISPDKLEMSDLSKDLVNEFLHFLEDSGKSISTRNQRLTAIKSFFSYAKYTFPEYLDLSRDILQIPLKKQPIATIRYLSVDGITKLLNQPNLNTENGYRDALILTILYECAARVTEVTDILVGDIRFSEPCTIVLHGKGSKDRIVPISKKLADLIAPYMEKINKSSVELRPTFLFANRSGNQLTRAGIAYILKKYVESAKKSDPDLIPEVFSPHCMRHSKAMHLLEAGVAMIYIRDFLGHSSITTTEIYAKADSKSKRTALEKAYLGALDPTTTPSSLWNEDENLMQFLSDLCRN